MLDAEIFYKKAGDWLHRLLEHDPVEATEMGDHRWDDRLPNRTAEALESQYGELISALADFQAMDTRDFTVDAAIDHTLVVQIIKALIRRHEKTRRYRRDPGSYIGEVMGGVFLLIMKEFAPLPDRLHSALGRVRETPRLLDEAISNIVPGDVPPVWAEVALEQAGQAPPLFQHLLPALAANAAPDLQTDLKLAGEAACGAIRTYADFIERQVLPEAKGSFAAGREIFDEMLREDHMVDYDADQLLETGRRLFDETKARMESAARQIDSARSVWDLLEQAKAEHPTAEGLLEAYQEAMQAAKQYVIDHEIATIPENETLRVIETPTYLRPLLPYAAYMPPGILEEHQDGLFLVTPVDVNAPAELQEQKLKGHNTAKLPITALHEAYPGHHLQLVWANTRKTLPRRMSTYLSSLFIEGWAFYCEELMEQLGFIGEPLQRLWRLKDQLWRAARIILDVSLHTRGMPVEDATDFLVRECRLEPSNALAEVRRYTGSPTQPQSYLMGKLIILELVDDYRRVKRDASMRQMHDAVLACGSLPPKLMRRQLLGE
jgi:uncharacterized protein (DUF885 family)